MFGTTDVGRIRKMNQDNYYFNSQQGIVVVADGIGGRKGGEIASGIAVKTIRDAFLGCDNLLHESVNPFLKSNVQKVNQLIIESGQSDPSIEGMGTTLNCLLFVGSKVSIAHLGDSRTYLFYHNHFWQLTIDHSIGIYVKRGWIPQETLTEKGSNPDALVRALGLSEHTEIDIYQKEIRQKEIYITCSDGLTSMVSDIKIAELISLHQNRLEDLPGILVAEANKNGGKDNITVVVSEVSKY